MYECTVSFKKHVSPAYHLSLPCLAKTGSIDKCFFYFYFDNQIWVQNWPLANTIVFSAALAQIKLMAPRFSEALIKVAGMNAVTNNNRIRTYKHRVGILLEFMVT